MSQIAAIKRHFCKRSQQYELRAKNEEDISVLMYAVQNSAYGFRNYIVGDKDDFRYVLKKSRNEKCDEIYRSRMRELNLLLSQDRYKGVRPYVLSGEEVEIEGHIYLCTQFIKCRNSFVMMRSGFSKKTVLHYLKMTLGFCQNLERAGDASESVSSEVKKIDKEFQLFLANSNDSADANWHEAVGESCSFRSMVFAPVHNDLGPINLLLKGSSLYVFDWEYWDLSLSIFNFFDVISNFGGMLATNGLSKRRPVDKISIFTAAGAKKKQEFMELCGEYAALAGYQEILPEGAECLFISHLKKKSILQKKLYGAHYGFDSAWKGILAEFLRGDVDFKRFWMELTGR